MSNPLKLHDLVALMNVAIGSYPHHTSRQNHIPVANITGGILNYDEGKERTFPILDALASICVSDPSRQVVAIALQLQLKDLKLCLTVAENEKVKDGLVNYLHEVWSMLRVLSGKFTLDRASSGKQAQHYHYRRVSPIMPHDVGNDIRISLFRYIYLYTRLKHKARVEKWWDRLSEFMERFHESRGKELAGIASDLQFAFLALRGAYVELDTKLVVQQNDEFWETLYTLFEVATCKVTRIIQQNPYFCDALVSEVDRNQKNTMRFNLSHALQKLTSHHRNLQCLIAFAHSPRFEPVFHCQISIIAVAPQVKRTVVLPQTLTQWEGIISKIVPPRDSAGGIWVTNEASSLMRKFGKHTKCDIPVHCECRLIEHFTKVFTSSENYHHNSSYSNFAKSTARNPNVQSTPIGKAEGPAEKVLGRKEASALCGRISDGWKSVPVFSYLGVSKLSCSACQMWIDAYNERGGPKFYTRGSHGKWYWPWAIPRLEEQDISGKMVDRISTTYYEHCRAKGRLRCPSDGSNARMSMGKTSMNYKHLAVATDYVSRMSL